VLVILAAISAMWTERRGAPWVPTTLSKVHRMLEMAEVGPGDVVYDLGCGDGRLIVAAVRRYGARAVGIEVDPLRYLWCQILTTVLGLRQRVRIVYGDFFSKDISEATVVTCYLLQDTNDRLVGKLRRELRPGTLVVSNSFTFPGLPLMRKDTQALVYVYALPGRPGRAAV
jgi:SAM-dependent methyltransferase